MWGSRRVGQAFLRILSKQSLRQTKADLFLLIRLGIAQLLFKQCVESVNSCGSLLSKLALCITRNVVKPYTDCISALTGVSAAAQLYRASLLSGGNIGHPAGGLFQSAASVNLKCYI